MLIMWFIFLHVVCVLLLACHFRLNLFCRSTSTWHTEHLPQPPAMSTKQARATKPTSADFYHKGKEVQNCSGHSTTAANEDCLFREYFGCGADKAMIAWNMLESFDMVPSGGQINHLLWTLFFMKQYPVEGVACGAVGGSKGKIDPKTYRRWVWPFLCALSDL